MVEWKVVDSMAAAHLHGVQNEFTVSVGLQHVAALYGEQRMIHHVK